MSTKPARDDFHSIDGPRDCADERDVQATDEKTAKLEYVEQILLELRAIAAGLDAATLVYLLEMSALEAAEATKVHRIKSEILSNN